MLPQNETLKLQKQTFCGKLISLVKYSKVGCGLPHKFPFDSNVSRNVAFELNADLKFIIMTEDKKQQKINVKVEGFKTFFGLLFHWWRAIAGYTVARTNSQQTAAVELKLQNEIQKTGYTIYIKRKI